MLFSDFEEPDYTFSLMPSPVALTVEDNHQVVTYGLLKPVEAALAPASAPVSERSPSPAPASAPVSERSPVAERSPEPVAAPTPKRSELVAAAKRSPTPKRSPEPVAAAERSPTPKRAASSVSDSDSSEDDSSDEDEVPAKRAASEVDKLPAKRAASEVDEDSMDEDEVPAKRAAEDSMDESPPPRRAAPSDDDDSSEEDEAPAKAIMKLPKRASASDEDEVRRVADASSEDEAESPPSKKARVEKEESESSEDDEAEAPRAWGAQSAKGISHGKARRFVSKTPVVRKPDVERWVRDSNAASIRANATNSRGGQRSLWVTSRFKVVGLPVSLGSLSTVRLAILQAHRASRSERPGAVELALDTLRALLQECGVNLSETEPREELMLFLATKVEKAALSTGDIGARVLEVMLASPFLEGAQSVMESVACLVANGKMSMLVVLLRERGHLLEPKDVFETITLTMVHGTPSMVLNSLQALRRQIRPTLRHETTGSTLLHFAAKRDEGRFVEAVLLYCDATVLDNKGRTALHYFAKSGASRERIDKLRAITEGA